MRKFANFKNNEFLKKVFFVWSKTSSNLTKLGIEYPMCRYKAGKKNFCNSLSSKKVGISSSKVNQIDITNYQYYLACNSKRMVRLTFLEKIRISIGIIDLIACYSLILFSKILKFYWVKELFKSDQTWYGLSPLQLECKTKKMV